MPLTSLSPESSSTSALAASLLDDSAITVEAAPTTQVLLRCSQLSYTIKTHSGPKAILSDVTCAFSPGKISALMGPSGSGKTTLLSTIAGHNHHVGVVTGELQVNGGLPPPDFKQLACVVPQDDILLSGLTPRESLMYAAELRLALPAAERRARVESLLDELSLHQCADVRCGNADTRGISGGQRKRVSLGLELITRPAVVMCDEPTSGLDSKMAEDVVMLLVSRREVVLASPARLHCVGGVGLLTP